MNRGLFVALFLSSFMIVFTIGTPVKAQSTLAVDVTQDVVLPGETIQIQGVLECITPSHQTIYIQIYDSDSDLVHQDVVDTITDQNGNFLKEWVLPTYAKSGQWEVVASWSKNSLVNDIARFRVGFFMLDTNITGVFVGEAIQFHGQLAGSECEGQTIYFQLFDANNELIYQRLSGVVTNETGHFALDWTAPQTTTTGLWKAIAAWSADRSFNDTAEFYVAIMDDIPPIIDTPPDVEFAELGTNNMITWDPEDYFPKNFSILREGIIVKSGVWNHSSETISVSAVGLPLGLYNFTARVFDQGNNSVTDTVMVTISDLTCPSVLDVEDLSIAEGSVGYEISWNASDLHPYGFEIWLNSSCVESGFWNDTTDLIYFSLDGLSYGKYNLTVVFIDESNNQGLDKVIIDVYDGTPPVIQAQPDVTFDYGQLGYQILWNGSDLHPRDYTVLRNESVFQEGIWNSSSEDIYIDLDGHRWGKWNYTLILRDIDYNTATDDVMVTVEVFDETPPVVSHPADIEMAEGTMGNQIIWNGTDQYPMFYRIYRNDTLLIKGLWNDSSEFFIISLDNFAYGAYNFTIVLLDPNFNNVSDSVIVDVYDGTPPMVSGSQDIEIPEGAEKYTIHWNLSDAHPNSYSILRNGVEVASTDWTAPNHTVVHSLDGLEYGLHNFTLVAYDIDQNPTASTIMVTIYDNTSPTIEGPEDISIEETEQGQKLVWVAYDDHPDYYKVVLDGEAIRVGEWNASGEEIIVYIDGLNLGDHYYCVLVYDIDRNIASSRVDVAVCDWISPIISGPNSITISEAMESASITWSATDLHPYCYSISRNGEVIAAGSWTSSPQNVSVSLENLPAGVFTFTAVFEDTSNNTAQHKVLVHIESVQTDTTTLPSTSEPIEGDSFLFTLVLTVAGIIGISILVGLILLERKTGRVVKALKDVLKKIGDMRT